MCWEFQIESVEIGNSAYYPTSYIRYEVSFEHDKYTENLWSLYEELNKIFDKIEMNYAEDENFDKVDVAWTVSYTHLDVYKRQVYSFYILIVCQQNLHM